MIFYPNQDTNLFARGIGLPAVVRTASFKARDSLTVDVVFHNGSIAVDLAEYSDLVFIVKSGFATGAAVFAKADEWEKVGTGSYRATLDLNTETLIAGIGDQKSITAYAELTWRQSGGGWETTNTLEVTIDNDLYKGVEGTPLVFPTPDQWLQARIGPVFLAAPPVDGVAAVKERIYVNFTGQTVTEDGSLRVYFINNVGEYLPDIYVAVDEGDNDATITQKVYNACLGDEVLMANYTVSTGSTQLYLERIVAETVVYPTQMHVSGGAVWGPFSSRSSLVVASGDPGSPGTTASFLHQLAHVDISDGDGGVITYTFRAIGTEPSIWEGSTSGLEWDDHPATGEPRWRVNRWVGTGDDRIFKLIDLNQDPSLIS